MLVVGELWLCLCHKHINIVICCIYIVKESLSVFFLINIWTVFSNVSYCFLWVFINWSIACVWECNAACVVIYINTALVGFQGAHVCRQCMVFFNMYESVSYCVCDVCEIQPLNFSTI